MAIKIYKDDSIDHSYYILMHDALFKAINGELKYIANIHDKDNCPEFWINESIAMINTPKDVLILIIYLMEELNK